MGGAVRQQLQQLRDELARAPSEPWSEVENWVARARPFFRKHLEDHLADFNNEVTSPGWAGSPRMTSNWDAVEALDKKTNEQIATDAKQRILSFVDGVLATLSEPTAVVQAKPVDPLPLDPDGLAEQVLRSLYAEYMRRGDRKFKVHASSAIFPPYGLDLERARRGLERSKDNQHVDEVTKGLFKLTLEGVNAGARLKRKQADNGTPRAAHVIVPTKAATTENKGKSQMSSVDPDPAAEPPNPGNDPFLRILWMGIKAHPATKYAVAVLAVGAAAALNVRLFGSGAKAFVGTVVMLGGLALFVVVARLVQAKASDFTWHVRIVLWTVTVLFSGSLVLLFTSFFFGEPLPLKWDPNAQAATATAEVPAGSTPPPTTSSPAPPPTSTATAASPAHPEPTHGPAQGGVTQQPSSSSSSTGTAGKGTCVATANAQEVAAKGEDLLACSCSQHGAKVVNCRFRSRADPRIENQGPIPGSCACK